MNNNESTYLAEGLNAFEKDDEDEQPRDEKTQGQVPPDAAQFLDARTDVQNVVAAKVNVIIPHLLFHLIIGHFFSNFLSKFLIFKLKFVHNLVFKIKLCSNFGFWLFRSKFSSFYGEELTKSLF